MTDAPTAAVGRPATSTPTRRRGSIRRTTTSDTTRPDGIEGRMVHVAVGRDLVTDPGGVAAPVDAARVEIDVGPGLAGRITRIELDPPEPGDALIGASPYSGFRKAVDDVLPVSRRSGSVSAQLLHDAPIALLLSGRVLRDAGLGLTPGGRTRARPTNVDVCAGWIDGGTAVLGYGPAGPPLTTGPEASPLGRGADLLAWHDHDALPAHSTRRRRRLDIWEEDGVGMIDCFFRDTHVDGDRLETVVHEYTLRATFDAATRTFLSTTTEFGVLPFPECPAAIDSVQRIEGLPVDGLRRWMAQEMTGPSTCTHLNDQLRSLEDIAALHQELRRRISEAPA